MEKEKATIYDFARMCKTYHTNCPDCPMWNEVCTFCIMDNTQVDKANEIILKWRKEHPIKPIKTRQSEFLKMFPNADISYEGYLEIEPCNIEKSLFDNVTCAPRDCEECKKNYWLAEVDE